MIEQMKKRVELGDAQAIYNLGVFYSEGLYGLPQDHAKASELYHQAGELGHTRSYFNIGILYYNGDGVERDEKMKTFRVRACQSQASGLKRKTP